MIRILIVDDQATIRESIKSLLYLEPNIEVVGIAEDGYQAIAQVKALKPDIVLMDIEMPNLDGFKATKLICQHNPNTKILILTGQDREDIISKALSSGAQGCLLKNMSAEDIVRAIRFVLEGCTEIQPEINNNRYALKFTNKNKKFKHNNLLEELQQPLDELIVNNKLSFSSRNSRELNFSFLLLVLKRRYFPALCGFFGVLFGALLYLIFTERIYQVDASIMISERQPSISELGRDLNTFTEKPKDYSNLASQVKLIYSRQIIEASLENFKKQSKEFNDNISLGEIQKNLQVKVIPNTNILEISYKNSDSQVTTKLLNTIVQTVINNNTETIRLHAKSLREFLKKEVAQQKIKVRQTEVRENQYRQERGIVALDEQTQNLVNNINSLENQEQSLLIEIKEKKAAINNLQPIAKTNNPESAYLKGRISQDKGLEQIKLKISEAESELALARSNFTDDSPTVISLLEKRERLLSLYNKTINDIEGNNSNISADNITIDGQSQRIIDQLVTNQIELSTLEDKLKAIKTEQEKLGNQLILLPDKVQSLNDLVHQREEAQRSLQFLQRKLEEARIAEAQLVSNIQIVELAQLPSSPSSPKPILVIVLATAIGTILAVGIILLLETIDDIFSDASEVEDKLQISFLGDLPDLSSSNLSSNKIKLFLQNRNLYEPYRALLKRLEVRCQNQLKLIIVTSSIAGEGKSTVASHLGVLSAMLSKRTLIIDAHLSQPQQYKSLNAKLQPGLTEILTKDHSFLESVQSTKINNLSVLTTGSTTSHSCTLLESHFIKSIMQAAINYYDLVIIDAPPVSNNSDAYTLSKYSNGLLMVTRPCYTPKNILQQTVSQLQQNNTPILGFVVNHAGKQKKQAKDNVDEFRSLSSPAIASRPTHNSHQNTKEISKP
ncbi:MAG: polysaccharide biosynthesis tyrosine autokinase [Pleurocapsa sp. MO_192.B19]|nr:polysaccharide biosynthesis tyrosine autokinase [Pleurocapsa sp. MO_192.B19]